MRKCEGVIEHEVLIIEPYEWDWVGAFYFLITYAMHYMTNYYLGFIIYNGKKITLCTLVAFIFFMTLHLIVLDWSL